MGESMKSFNIKSLSLLIAMSIALNCTTVGPLYGGPKKTNGSGFLKTLLYGAGSLFVLGATCFFTNWFGNRVKTSKKRFNINPNREENISNTNSKSNNTPTAKKRTSEPKMSPKGSFSAESPIKKSPTQESSTFGPNEKKPQVMPREVRYGQELVPEEVAQIPGYLTDSIKVAGRYFDIDFYQLHTVDQTKDGTETIKVDDHIELNGEDGFIQVDDKTSVVETSEGKLVIRYIPEKDIARYIRYAKAGDSRFSPGEICPVLAVRGAYLHNLILASENNEEKTMFLDMLNSTDHAALFLKRLADNNKATSRLDTETLVGRIEELGLSDRITVIESVNDFHYPMNTPRTDMLKYTVTQRFQERENYFHTFIINTGDMAYGVTNVREQVEQDLNCKIDNEDFVKFWRTDDRLRHWYVMSIRKQGDYYSCFITDTLLSHNHIDNNEYRDRNLFLCKKFIYGDSIDGFNDIRNAYARDLLIRKITTEDDGEKLKTTPLEKEESQDEEGCDE